jgi:DNA polymerase-3 subunit gamma/tau
MGYIALALKYRPKNFDEVVGQEHVVSALKNAILKNRLHHAYLFSGPRGVGKTSLARIFAKSLNCIQGPTINPCQKCTSCTEINKGTSLDVIEIDGASNRGIDEIRTLRESVKLIPAYSRYKIYIIDEVHMLTQEAFNALLKTLEEPPQHVKFIFATTHLQKVLPTILSRCQKFQFNLLPFEKIVEKLKKIISLENLIIEEDTLYAIARASGGSIRDAESLLDTIIPVILEKGKVEDVFSFLGIFDEDTLNKTLKYIVEKDINALLYFIDELTKEGKDLVSFINSLIGYLRNLLLAKVSIKGFRELTEISSTSKEFILNLSDLIMAGEILKIIDLLVEAKDLCVRLNNPRIPLEFALIRFCLQEENINHSLNNFSREMKNENLSYFKNKEIEKNIQSNKEDLSYLNKKIEDIDLDDVEINIDDFEIEENENKIEEKVSYDAEKIFKELKERWKEIISEIKKTRAAIASHLSFGFVYDYKENFIEIAFYKKNSFHKEIVGSNKNLKFIQETISKFIGKKVVIKFILIENQEEQVTEEKKEEEEAIRKENEFINELLDTFKGKIHTENE